MNWRIGQVVLAGAVLTAAAAPSATAGTTGASILDWNARAAQLIVGPGGAAKAPPLAFVDLAIVHTAIYDAVNATEGFPYRSYHLAPSVPGEASGDAAAAAAGRATLIALFPARAAEIEAWYAASLAAIPDGDARARGVAVGAETAAGILALRANDGRNAGTPIVEPAAAPGVWVRTPPAFAAPQVPWARFVTPWHLDHPAQIRPPAPPPLQSARFRRDYEETRDFGAATGGLATSEQKDVARFWSDNPVLQWNRAWRGIAVARGLSGLQAARYFAILATAGADTLIACWDAKYEYMFWRPVTAIRATEDPSWSALVTTPNHPEYPGGHGCLSGASTSALKRYFNTGTFAFTIDSAAAGVASPVRAYSSFSQAIDEVHDARVWGGMHYRSSSEAGAWIGKKAARRAVHAFRAADDEDEMVEERD